MNPNLFWIPGPWRGRLAVAARPRGGAWLDDEAAGWRRADLDVIVSLLENEETAQLEMVREREVAESNGVAFISFPIPDRGMPASMPDVLSLLKTIVEALEKGKNVAVHCRQGIGRSGLIAVGALMTSGLGAEKAIEIVSTARGLTVPETPAQLRWIHDLSSEHLAVTSS
jgi:protein-tyrosine phosphatase